MTFICHRPTLNLYKGKNWYVSEREFDHDLHEFWVFKKTKEGYTCAGIITPDSIEAMNAIIKDLNAGESPDGWENGNGQTISI